MAITWEFHTKFITVSWISALADGDNWPPCLCLDALDTGLFVGATRLDVTQGRRIDPELLPGFAINSLCLSGVENDAGEVATDFVVNQDLYTRLEAAFGELSTFRRSAMLRRLLEVETYRVMALMGLSYQTRWRLTLAHGLLRQANARVSDVARQVGYDSDVAFQPSV